MTWRCLKEGFLFNEHYEIHRVVRGYRVFAKAPLRLIGEVSEGQIKVAKELCEQHLSVHP